MPSQNPDETATREEPRFRLNRREWLAGSAGVLGLWSLDTATAHPLSAAMQESDTGTESSQQQPYVLEDLGDGLYFLTNGTYQNMFLVTNEGVVVVDAPPSLVTSLFAAIEEVTNQPITHLVYSHYHADHIGGASLFDDEVEIIAHEMTEQLLSQFDDPNRPAPTKTFAGSYNLEVGGGELELDYRGPNHTPDNLFIYAPDQAVLMLVDVIFPGWIPFKALAVSQNIQGFIQAHETALRYDFETLVAGHLAEPGTRADVRTQLEFVTDLKANAEAAIESVNFQSVAQEVGTDNPWVLFDAYLDALTEHAAAATLETWAGRLRGAEVFMASHAETMVEALRIDYGILGPFGPPEEVGGA
ncbi:MBL fold metallo-hydrolase [Haloarcula nitratireducens]|uniref:MBL fold metallo-hydrolase n=1 Tax=Haloarcula nitratireducens TaxID=2487749 RepID=A0AAW4PJJ0_9EURY|nr:MBL fold metallo-hydrolase [Halomicroarcula nitratireducens]MBX0297626.1 MBL fold metallo-hydrolase [Halomicroarcula nitratireducens]